MSTIHFEPFASHHLPILHKWMQQPHVSRWWGDNISWTDDAIEKKYRSCLQGYKMHNGEKKDIFPFVITYHHKPIGYIQMYRAADFPSEKFDLKENLNNSAALDFYIGEADCIVQGIGSDILKAFLSNHLFPKYSSCLVDPEKGNKGAIKTYAKAGFSTLFENDSTIIMEANREEKINPILIMGSSRSDGQTLKAVQALLKSQNIPIIDLMALNIAHFDYSYENKNDDFLPLAEKMVRHNPIILATPIYWYTMSAMMKIFIDRWNDLCDIRKDIGKRLTNKELYVIASYGSTIPKNFEDPFSHTCEYMDMHYKGCYYYYTGDKPHLNLENEQAAERLSREIFQLA